MVKSKLSPRSGSVALRQLNRIHKRGHKVLNIERLEDYTPKWTQKYQKNVPLADEDMTRKTIFNVVTI